MVRPLFVSHSSPKNTTLHRTETIVAALNAAFVPTFFDRQSLEDEQFWYDAVERAMATCRAALILLDATALASAYVQHEIQVLAHRSSTEPDFPLVVALLDPGISRTSLGTGLLRTTRIAEHQIWVPADADLADPDALARAVVAKVVRTLGGPPHPGNRLGQLLAKVERCVATLDIDVVGEAIAGLENNAGAAHDLHGFERRGSLAMVRRQLASWLVETACSEPMKVFGLLNALRGELEPKRKHLSGLIRTAQSYWLGGDPDLCALRRMTLPAGRGGLLAVNGALVPDYTAETFAFRATWPNGNFVVVTCDDGVEDVEGVAGVLRASLRGITDARQPTDREINFKAREGNPIICVLPKGFLSGSANWSRGDALRQRFGAVVFVACPGEALVLDFLPPTIAAVDPAVDPVLEDDHALAWGEMKEVLGEPDVPRRGVR